MERIDVYRGGYGDPVAPFGPLPGIRHDDVVAYEFELPPQFEPRPGFSRLERVFVLVDIGVSFSLPQWKTLTIDGRQVDGIDAHRDHASTWYVDLIHVEADHSRSTPALFFRDLYVDVMVPTDGRHYRMLDLDELADAVTANLVPVHVAADGLRRWQTFLDRHLHADRDPTSAWSDFPPLAIADLAALPAPLGPVVTAP